MSVVHRLSVAACLSFIFLFGILGCLFGIWYWRASNQYLWYLIFCTVSFIFGGCINIWGGVINKAGPKIRAI